MCLIKNCNRSPARRGLCNACYQTFYKAIRAKKTTWAKLEKRGLALSSRVSPAAEAMKMIGGK